MFKLTKLDILKIIYKISTNFRAEHIHETQTRDIYWFKNSSAINSMWKEMSKTVSAVLITFSSKL